MWVVEPDHGEDGAHFAAVIHLEPSSVQHTFIPVYGDEFVPTHSFILRKTLTADASTLLRQQIH